jgi:hypothetical protein
MARKRKAAARRTTARDDAVSIPAKLSRLVDAPQKDKLRWWFDVGHEMLRLNPPPGPGTKRHYGDKTALKIAQHFRPNDATKAKSMSDMLVQARKLALRFAEWKVLEKFQGDLSIWQVMSLLAVDKAKGSKSTMEEMHRRCRAENWSVDRLKREVQNDKGVKLKSGHRPKPLRPATPAVAVADLIIAARQWTTYYDAWLKGQKSALKHTRGADYSSNLLRDVQEAIQGLEQVQNAVKEELAELQQLAKKIASTLKG